MIDAERNVPDATDFHTPTWVAFSDVSMSTLPFWKEDLMWIQNMVVRTLRIGNFTSYEYVKILQCSGTE
eukprot:3562551-Ditylum_brightwellii.AAC.1